MNSFLSLLLLVCSHLVRSSTMALSKGFRIFEKKQPNHSIIMEHRQRSQEALLFESQAVAVLCKHFYHWLSVHSTAGLRVYIHIIFNSIPSTNFLTLEQFSWQNFSFSSIPVNGFCVMFFSFVLSC